MSLERIIKAAIAQRLATEAPKTIFVNPTVKATLIEREAKQRKAQQQKDARTIRLTNGLGLTMSDALFQQLERYITEHKIPRSRAIRRAVYEALHKPNTVKRGAKLPALTLPPARPHVVSWSMSSKEDRKLFDYECSRLKLSASTFTRRAIYNYTKAHASDDKTHRAEIAADITM